MIPMRDGVRLNPMILTPANQTTPLPFIVVRTPYMPSIRALPLLHGASNEEDVRMKPNKAMWMAVSAGAGALGMTVVRGGLNRAWKLARDEDPPDNPASWDVTWRDAIVWTLATGVVIGLGRLLALRGAAAGWQRVTGRAPPA